MKTYSFRIVVEPDGERWHAFCPALVGQGGATWGNTQQEALKNIQEVVQMVVESLMEHGEAWAQLAEPDLDEHLLVLGGGVHATLVLTAHQGGDRGGDAGGNPVDFADRAQDSAFHGAGSVFDLIDGGIHGVIDLLQTDTGTVARVVEQVANAFDLIAPGTDDGDGFVRVFRDPGADILHDLVGAGGDSIHPLDKRP